MFHFEWNISTHLSLEKFFLFKILHFNTIRFFIFRCAFFVKWSAKKRPETAFFRLVLFLFGSIVAHNYFPYIS
jgi:hypothetical protein